MAQHHESRLVGELMIAVEQAQRHAHRDRAGLGRDIFERMLDSLMVGER